MSTPTPEKDSKADKKSFTALETSKISATTGGISVASRNEIMKRLKKNRKQIKLQFMRRFPKIGVPNFKSLGHLKRDHLGPLDSITKNNNKIHEVSMYDPNMTLTNVSQAEDDNNLYPDHSRIRVLWHFCLGLFLFAILFLIGSVIYLLARS